MSRRNILCAYGSCFLAIKRLKLDLTVYLLRPRRSRHYAGHKVKVSPKGQDKADHKARPMLVLKLKKRLITMSRFDLKVKTRLITRSKLVLKVKPRLVTRSRFVLQIKTLGWSLGRG